MLHCSWGLRHWIVTHLFYLSIATFHTHHLEIPNSLHTTLGTKLDFRLTTYTYRTLSIRCFRFVSFLTNTTLWVVKSLRCTVYTLIIILHPYSVFANYAVDILKFFCSFQTTLITFLLAECFVLNITNRALIIE